MASEILNLIITSTNAGAVKGLNETGNAATGLQTKTTLADKAMSSLGLSGVKTGSLLQAGLVGAGVVAIAAVGKAAFDGVSKFASLTGEVRQFQRVSLASSEDASKLVFAVKRLGIEPQAASAAIGMMAKRIGDGSVNLKDFGIQVERNADGTINLAGTLLNVSDKFKNTADASERAALGAALFGKGWQTLIPLLGKGKEELQGLFDIAEKQGLIFDDAQLEAGRKYTLALKDLGTAAEGLQIQLGQALVPVLTDLAGGFTTGLEAVNAITAPLGGLGNVLKTLISGGTAPFVHSLAAVSNVMKGDFLGAAESAIRTVPVLGNVVADVIPFFDDAATATDKLKDAQNNVNEAMGRVRDLQAEGKQGTAEYRDAQQQLATAVGALAAENDKQAASFEKAASSIKLTQEAVDAYTNSVIAAQAGPLQLEAAERKLEQAHTAVTAASLQLTDAINTYGEGSIQAAVASDNLKDAQLQESLASLAAQDAALKSDQAIRQLTDAFTSGETSATQTKAALLQLAAAHPELQSQVQTSIAFIDLLTGSVNAVPEKKDTTFWNNAADVIGDVFNLAGAVTSVPTFWQTTFSAVSSGFGVVSAFLNKRAAGGPVSAGMPYVVGENRPELFVPDVNGTIVPRVPTRSRGGGFGAGAVPMRLDRLESFAEQQVMLLRLVVAAQRRVSQPGSSRAILAPRG